MTNFQLQAPARTCSATGRELIPGERMYSVLLDEAGRFVRHDYAAEGWKAPPAEAIAWWAGRVPQAGRPAKPTINDDLLVDCFDHLTDTSEPARLNFRYVVALLLMRRKRFKFEDAKKVGDREVLIVRDARNGKRHEVPDPQLSDVEMDAVQDEVFRVLGW